MQHSLPFAALDSTWPDFCQKSNSFKKIPQCYMCTRRLLLRIVRMDLFEEREVTCHDEKNMNFGIAYNFNSNLALKMCESKKQLTDKKVSVICLCSS